MRIRESIVISASPGDVWPFVADPVAHAQWNPKVVSVDRRESGPARLGEQFEMLYRMRGRERHSSVEVTVCQPLQRIAFLHKTVWKSQEQVAEETYELSCGNGVKLVQTIDFSRTGVNWLLCGLIWLLHRFGSTEDGKPQLDGLKRVVEESIAKP